MRKELDSIKRQNLFYKEKMQMEIAIKKAQEKRQATNANANINNIQNLNITNVNFNKVNINNLNDLGESCFLSLKDGESEDLNGNFKDYNGSSINNSKSITPRFDANMNNNIKFDQPKNNKNNQTNKTSNTSSTTNTNSTKNNIKDDDIISKILNKKRNYSDNNPQPNAANSLNKQSKIYIYLYKINYIL
jgi:hypothetical protein